MRNTEAPIPAPLSVFQPHQRTLLLQLFKEPAPCAPFRSLFGPWWSEVLDPYQRCADLIPNLVNGPAAFKKFQEVRSDHGRSAAAMHMACIRLHLIQALQHLCIGLHGRINCIRAAFRYV